MSAARPISCFVMSGGVGSRLWPLSREDNPKQFHDLAGDGSMLVKTIRRLRARSAGDAPVHLIASERHAERVRDDLAGLDLGGGGAIFEPVVRVEMYRSDDQLLPEHVRFVKAFRVLDSK